MPLCWGELWERPDAPPVRLAWVAVIVILMAAGLERGVPAAAPEAGSALSVFDFAGRGLDARNNILSGLTGPRVPVCAGSTVRSLGWTSPGTRRARSPARPTSPRSIRRSVLWPRVVVPPMDVPAPGSPAIDSGADAARCPPVDQRGQARPAGLAYDRSSVERGVDEISPRG